MIRTVFSLALICSNVHGSGVHQLGSPIDAAPVVTAASSQYFERTFNRLVAAPPLVPVAPAPPFIHAAPATPQLVPVAPAPPVVIHTAQALPAPLPPSQVIPFHNVQPVQGVPIQPTQPLRPAQPVDPNVAIAIATAHAAPVATFLLPPYPFGFPPGYGYIPQEQPSNVNTKSQEPEQTTMTATTQVEMQTSIRETEATTPLPADPSFDQASSNQDPNFKQFSRPAPFPPQPQPSNQDVDFRKYLTPVPPRPQAQPSNQDVNFREYLAPMLPRPQAEPSNQNVNFRHYLAPALQRPSLQPQPQQQLPYSLPQPLPHHHHSHVHFHSLKPQKLETLVEVVRAPLAYIAPPPVPQYPHNYESVKVVKHVHTFVPARAKLVIRPVSHHHTRSVPLKIIEYKASAPLKATSRKQNLRRSSSREAEFTTFRPFLIPTTKPPRL